MNPATSGSVLSSNAAIVDANNYTPGGHKSSAHGVTFHEQCLLLCAYRSLASGKEFRIACEFEEAGKFDDLVYFHEADGEVACELIQYKHRANARRTLCWSDLASDAKRNVAYSLVEYFRSYLRFSARFETRFGCRINGCVLSTNQRLGRDPTRPDPGEDFELDDVLERVPDTRLFCNGISYRFRPECRAKVREVLLKKMNLEMLDEFAAHVERLKKVVPNVEMIEKLAANVETFKKIAPKFETLERVAANVRILEKFDRNVEMFKRIAANVEMLERFAANDEISTFARNVKTFDRVVPTFATSERFAANVELLERIAANVETFETLVANVEMFEKTAVDVRSLERFAADVELLEKTAANVETKLSEKTGAESTILKHSDESVEIFERMATNSEMFLANVEVLEGLAPNVEELKSVLDAVGACGDEFLERFVLCVENTVEDGRLETEIKREIATCLRNRLRTDEQIADNLDRVDDIYTCLYNRMNRFHASRETVVATESDCLEWLLEANRTTGGDALSVHHEHNMHRLAAFGTDLFTRDSIKKLKDFLTNRKENTFCVVGRHRTVFALLKLVQALKEIGKRFHVIVDDQFLASSDERVTIGEYLIVNCESRENWNRVLEKTRRALGNNTEKKIALVIGFGDCSALNRICDETRWSDLTENTRQSLGDKSISFQGIDARFSVLDVSGVEQRIDERVLDDVFREKLTISKRFVDEKSEETAYFVDRRIGRRNRIDLESIRNSDRVFVVENMTESEYESFIVGERFDRTRFRLGSESDFDDLCRKHRDQNISLLYHVEKMFYRKRNRGESIENLICPAIDLNDVTCVTDQTVLIVAEPGMGKSNLLSVLLERSVVGRPDVWIVKVDLGSHTERFDDVQNKQERFCKESAIEFVVESQAFETCFESDLFRSYFDLDDKLIVLLDGFDEIAPDYRETVLELIVRLSSISKIRVWLTSRPQERDYLESRLGLVSYSLLAFTARDQREFFARFWVRNGDVVDGRAQHFVDRLLCIAVWSFRSTGRLVAGVPLQCRMLGEVYRSRFEAFRRSENVDPDLPHAFDISDLYEVFKRKMFERCVVEKLKLKPTRPAHRKLIEKVENDLNESHKLLSLEIVFPHRFEMTHATKLDEYKERIVDGEERTGIVHSLDSNGRPVFLHRTFAEYFSALWFHDELTGRDRETKRELIDHLEENMFEARYEVFREFFDRLSARSDPLLAHVLNDDLESLGREFGDDPDLEIDSRVDAFSRNALHLAASRGNERMIGFLFDRGARTDTRDGLFGWTPLKYGLASDRGRDLDHDTIEMLFPGNGDDRTTFDRIADRGELLLYASEYGNAEIVEYLLKHGTDVNYADDDGRSSLDLAAENGHDDVCATLIEYGSRIDRGNDEGRTPPHSAAASSSS